MLLPSFGRGRFKACAARRASRAGHKPWPDVDALKKDLALGFVEHAEGGGVEEAEGDVAHAAGGLGVEHKGVGGVPCDAFGVGGDVGGGEVAAEDEGEFRPRVWIDLVGEHVSADAVGALPEAQAGALDVDDFLDGFQLFPCLEVGGSEEEAPSVARFPGAAFGHHQPRAIVQL